MADCEQAGLEADCAGNLYAVNQGTGQVLVLPSGETGFCDFMDIPWLDETPKTGGIAANSSASIQLDFNTDTPRRGLHQAELFIGGLDPFAPLTVPVTYTIAFLDVPETPLGRPPDPRPRRGGVSRTASPAATTSRRVTSPAPRWRRS